MAEAELASEQGQQVRDGDGPAAKSHLFRDVDEPLPESPRFGVKASREHATALRAGLVSFSECASCQSVGSPSRRRMRSLVSASDGPPRFCTLSMPPTRLLLLQPRSS